MTLYAVGFPSVLASAAIFPLTITRNRLRRAANLQALSQLRKLPLCAWLFVAWSLVCALFYIRDNTHIQTRYLLVTGPGLTIACMAALRILLTRRSFFVFTAAAIAFSLAISLYTVWPYIANKCFNDMAVRRMADYIDRNLPPNDGVSVYAIGELAFFCHHPVIDTGGITRPSLLRVNDDAITAWTKSQGAKYAITGSRPEPDAVLIHTEGTRGGVWSLHPASYREPTKLELWRLQMAPASAVPSGTSAQRSH